MATIVNNPPANSQPSENNSGMNWIFAIVFLIVLFFLIAYFLLPAIRRATSVPQVNIPDQVDVNVNTPGQ